MNLESFQGLQNFEREPNKFERECAPVVKFSMDLARHSIKGKLPDGREPLTTEGMETAVQAGKERPYAAQQEETQAGVKVYGSPRERTTQSSVLRALAEKFRDASFSGAKDVGDGKDLDPQELVNALKEAGLDSMETPLLNFALGDGEYTSEIMADFKAGKFFKYLVEQSDAAAKKYKQDPEEVTPLSIQAGNVAYFLFGRVVGLYTPSSIRDQSGVLMEFGTSHQGVLESFLYKIIKRHDGSDAAAEFVASLGNHGFKENAGFRVDGKVYDADDTGAWNLEITYQGKKYVVSPEELYAIMREGDMLKEELKVARQSAE